MAAISIEVRDKEPYVFYYYKHDVMSGICPKMKSIQLHDSTETASPSAYKTK